ncbi:MAG: hypothetical protein HOP27_03045 [Anaerolineales bacterium]|nr:hypothetical protein [Anaerolineales bacterium]
MLHKPGVFLRPHKTTIFVFLVFILIMPVFYIYSEPERINYLFGEKQHWLIKTEYFGSPLGEYLFHTEGNIDIFIGILARDYFDNYIGIMMLVFYYIIACGISSFIRKAQNNLRFKKV